jgi:hypothetical protein
MTDSDSVGVEVTDLEVGGTQTHTVGPQQPCMPPMLGDVGFQVPLGQS